MNRLWIRLSFAFGCVVLVDVAILIIASFVIAHSGIRESLVLDDLQSPGGLMDRLALYYEDTGSWDGLENVLVRSTREFTLLPKLGLILFVMDTQGQILYSTFPEMLGEMRDIDSVQAKAPIQVQGVVRGYVGVEEPKLSLPPAQTRLVLEGLSRGMLTLAVIGGTIGVIFGVLVGRRLAAPLSRLTEAARAIGAQKLSRRVKVEGTTEVKELASAFNEMAAALEQNEKLRRNLVADVAHELRTPLTVLQGNLRAILDEVYPMDSAEVARLYDQTVLLSRLVNDLHELSQAEARQLPLNLQPVQVGDLVDTIVATFSSLAVLDGVTLKVVVPPDLPPLLADSARLSQVLHNLLNNALAHTPKGGQITIRAEYGGDVLRLSVQDTGDGIPPEHLPYIFERFYRVDPSRNRHTGGTGLGLAIVKAIVEAHGGHITVASDSQGSIFTIEFPLAEIERSPAFTRQTTGASTATGTRPDGL